MRRFSWTEAAKERSPAWCVALAKPSQPLKPWWLPRLLGCLEMGLPTIMPPRLGLCRALASEPLAVVCREACSQTAVLRGSPLQGTLSTFLQRHRVVSIGERPQVCPQHSLPTCLCWCLPRFEVTKTLLRILQSLDRVSDRGARLALLPEVPASHLCVLICGSLHSL